MKYANLCSLLLILISSPALQAENAAGVSPTKQVYVPAKLWSGLLILQNSVEPDANMGRYLSLLKSSNQPRTGYVASANTEPATALVELFGDQELHTRIDLNQLFSGNAEALSKLSELQLLWIQVEDDNAQAAKDMSPETRRTFIGALRKILLAGGIVYVAGNLRWVGTDAIAEENLLQHCAVNADPTSPTISSLMQLNVPEGGKVAISNRQAICMSETPVTLLLPTTEYYVEPLLHTLNSGESVDWVQQTRAYFERQQSMFPSNLTTNHQLAGGSLVIVGGGGMPREVWQKFIELAGGENSRIVILPTAVAEPTITRGPEHRLLKSLGAGEVITLPQIGFDEVSSEEYINELDRATGVWFGGGRQWHFVDAYWGTPAWPKLIDVCKRGGVIGGSSAGATIQGDVLVRGAPAGNQIMLADGYRHGLGLLPSVAIDQHFAQRNRFRDLENCLSGFPTVFGIGIDEQTALIVKAPNECEVMGTGSVWCYPSSNPSPNGEQNDVEKNRAERAESRTEYKSGSKFTLHGPAK